MWGKKTPGNREHFISRGLSISNRKGGENKSETRKQGRETIKNQTTHTDFFSNSEREIERKILF